jgi:hypothetical protein
MSVIFRFEADFAETLGCIPMAVRMKLDTCGIKLKLAEWSKLTAEERSELLTAPCGTSDEMAHYRSRLQNLVLARTQAFPADLLVEADPAWQNTAQVPPSLLEKAAALSVVVRLEHWQQLGELERFALVKLSRPSHESKNFPRALREFGLMP